MNIAFKYNGKIWNPKNPAKKLKQLGITWDDVEIIENQENQKDPIEYQNPELYVFKNKLTGEVILSIYDDLDLQAKYIDVNDYEFIGMQEYDSNGKGKW